MVIQDNIFANMMGLTHGTQSLTALNPHAAYDLLDSTQQLLPQDLDFTLRCYSLPSCYDPVGALFQICWRMLL